MTFRNAARVAAMGGAFLMLLLLLMVSGNLRGTPRSDATIICPPITGIAHITLRSNHLAEAKRFYHNILGFDELPGSGGASGRAGTIIFKVNDHQYIEISPGQDDPAKDLLLHIAFETTNARGLRNYLAWKNLTRIGKLRSTRQGNLGFTVRDPEGHPIEFVQYLPGSIDSRAFGKEMPATRVSTRIIHAGFIVGNRAAEDRFFQRILGFHLMWYGGMTDQATDWVDMRVRNGSNWLEYMLNARDTSLHTLGVLYHFSLEVPSVAKAYKTVVARGYEPKKPQIGRDGKWQLNLYDPDGTRVELMEPKPVRKPCCSPMLLAGKSNF
jgi:catechol 2,3-dioxygenase-like lactoylglutathione lyase family enzyme